MCVEYSSNLHRLGRRDVSKKVVVTEKGSPPTTFIQHSLPQFPQPSFAFSDISEWRTSADCHRILRQFLQTLFLTLRTFPLYDLRRLLSVLAPRP
jgi:hypothetical protein